METRLRVLRIQRQRHILLLFLCLWIPCAPVVLSFSGNFNTKMLHQYQSFGSSLSSRCRYRYRYRCAAWRRSTTISLSLYKPTWSKSISTTKTPKIGGISVVTRNQRNMFSTFPSSSVLSALASSNDSKSNTNNPKSLEDIEAELSAVQSKASKFTNNIVLNLNSPKQIAKALYHDNDNDNDNSTDSGSSGTSREVLEDMTLLRYGGRDVTEEPDERIKFQKELASLVLHYRVLRKEWKKLKDRKEGAKNYISISGDSASVQSQSHSQGHSRRQNQNIWKAAFSTSSGQGSKQVESGSDIDNSILTNGKEMISRHKKKTSKAPILPLQNQSQNYSDAVDALFSPLSSPSSSSSSASKTTASASASASAAKKENFVIDPYWQEALQKITKPSARELTTTQLNPYCPMGFTPQTKTAGQRGSLLDYVRQQKRKYPDAVILTRVGEFYEAFGIDAIMLVQHCGLNPMGSKARAGCPIKNVQATLDGLTETGFRVAVYEEANDIGASNSNSKRVRGRAGIKNRMLAQIVSPAEPTYLYNLVLSDTDATRDALFTTPAARPYVGIINSKAGYDIVEISLPERTVRVTERVTAEAVACRLASYPPADPLFYVPSAAEEEGLQSSSISTRLPFLPSRWETDRDGPGSRTHIRKISPAMMPIQTKDMNDIQRSKQCILSALLQIVDFESDDDYEMDEEGGKDNTSRSKLSHEDFILLASLDDMTMARNEITFTKPLYVETASQLGLMADPTIPSLIQHLVPVTSTAQARDFLRRWLLTPPPPQVASSMASMVAYLKDDCPPLPSFEIPPLGKVLSLIRAGEASAQIFREVLLSLEATVDVLNIMDVTEEVGAYKEGDDIETDEHNFIISLMDILRYESGIDAVPANLRHRCLDAAQIIEDVVSIHGHHDSVTSRGDKVTGTGDIVPLAFYERNEKHWRGRIKPEASPEAYDDVAVAATALIEAIAVDFWGASAANSLDSAKESKTPIVQDVFNNLIHLKTIPEWANDRDMYYHPPDRNGKRLRNRYTTRRVEEAIGSYVEACDHATNSVGAVLRELSETLCDTGQLPAITQAAHINLILSTACQHTSQANQMGWNLAKIVDHDDKDAPSCSLNNLSPYWMDRSVAVLNTFKLDAMFLLTAPNMSGKSTVMRSAAAAALLTNCGFCAPVGTGSAVKRFDSIFVRGASADVPSENKSAFGAEMGDIAALLRACGSRSLVFVDELGRGTSPEDGASLAGAVLESMASSEMNGFFATHLHAILDLPLQENATRNITKKQMETVDDGDDIRLSYKLIDGVCTDSKAFKTAARFGIPMDIIERAENLSMHVANNCDGPPRSGKSISSDNAEIVPSKINQDGDASLFAAAVNVIEEISGEPSNVIKPRWSSPPKFEGVSCVYAIYVEGSFYVGETNGLAQRIRQHRKKGKQWASSEIIVVKVDGGKTDARNIESRVIQKMAQRGFNMLSTADGTKIKPRSRSDVY